MKRLTALLLAIVMAFTCVLAGWAEEEDQVTVVHTEAAPTAAPTAAPMAAPTAAPTVVPTAAPTAEPTAAPTAEPTAVPTAEPTAVPTAEPAAVPTDVPVETPAATAQSNADADVPEVTDAPSQVGESQNAAPAAEEEQAADSTVTEAPVIATEQPAEVFEAGYISVPAGTMLYEDQKLSREVLRLAENVIAYAEEQNGKAMAVTMVVDGKKATLWIRYDKANRLTDAEVKTWIKTPDEDAVKLDDGRIVAAVFTVPVEDEAETENDQIPEEPTNEPAEATETPSVPVETTQPESVVETPEPENDVLTDETSSTDVFVDAIGTIEEDEESSAGAEVTAVPGTEEAEEAADDSEEDLLEEAGVPQVPMDEIVVRKGVSGEYNQLTWSLEDDGTLTISGTGAMPDDASLESIPWNDYRNDIVRVNIDNGITHIGVLSFASCTQLTSVSIPTSVTSIGASAFAGCSNLASITLPNGLTDIGENVFSGCGAITALTIPDSVRSIGMSAFAGMTGLRSISLPEGITTIENGTFSGCTGLTAVYLPSSLTRVGQNAFLWDDGIVDVWYRGTKEQWDEITFEANNTGLLDATLHATIGGECGDGVRWTLDDGTLTITGSGAMTDYTRTDVPWREYRETITAINLDGGITHIGAYAFYVCAITEIDFPESLTSVGDYAFALTKLTSVAIPAGITSWGTWVFSGSNVEKAVFEDGVTVIPERIFYDAKQLESVSIPESVTAIDDYAFAECAALTDITLPAGLLSIGSYAFSNTHIATQPLPSGLTSIGGGAFRYCRTFKGQLDIPQGITVISARAFYGTGITAVSIPANVTEIGEYAFWNCSYLTDVYYDGTQAQWSDIAVAQNNEPMLYAALHTSDAETPVQGLCGMNATWHYADGTLTISGTGETYSYSLKSTPWNQYWGNDITTVIINEGITLIGSSAFKDEINLTTVSLPNTLLTIRQNVFEGCSSLAVLQLPDSLTTIEGGAFAKCTQLTTLELPASLTSLSLSSSCITSISLPDGMTEVSSSCFQSCKELTGVHLPDSVTSIGSQAFYGCTKLTDIDFPVNLTEIGDSAFYDCDALTSLQIPDSVQTIGRAALGHMSSLTQITLPEGLTTISERTFYWCGKLAEVRLPASLETVEKDAFIFCSAISDVYYSGTIEQWEEITFAEGNNSVRYAPLHTASAGEDTVCGLIGEGVRWTLTAPDTLTISGTGEMGDITSVPPWNKYKDDITTVVIETGVTRVGVLAFYGCTGLTSVTFPATLIEIGNAAFNGCTGLTAIDLPETLTTIGNSAFNGCTGLTTIDLPEALTTIGSSAFNGCTGLTTIDLPDNLTTISISAFAGCTGLTSIVIPASVTLLEQEAFRDCSALQSASFQCNITAIPDYLFRNCTQLSSVQLPENLTAIGVYSFYGCKLAEIDLPGTVVSIGKMAFAACSALTSVDLPDGLTTLGPYAFHYTGLTEISLPEGITQIDHSTFYFCTKLTTVHLPAGLTSVDSNAFSDCSALADVYYAGTTEQWAEVTIADRNEPLTMARLHTADEDYVVSGTFGENITWSLDVEQGILTFTGTGATDNVLSATSVVPWEDYKDNITTVVFGDGITSIGRYVCCGLTALTDVSLPDTLTQIGNYAFKNSGLTSVTLPDGLTDYSYAFHQCGALAQVVLPANAVSVSPYAFYQCSALTSIDLPESLTTIGDHAFDGSGLIEVVLPSGLTAYPNAFANCTSLQRAVLSEGITLLDQGAFAYCTKLQSLVLPQGLTTIGNDSLRNTQKLRTIDLPDTLTEIGSSAFYYSWLTEIDIPDSVTTIGSNAFAASVYLQRVTLPQGLTAIPSLAFDSCRNLKEISLPDTVTEISERAFYGCYVLTTVNMPVSVVQIDRSAFYACNLLAMVNYAGYDEDWEAIQVAEGNDPLLNAARHTASDTLASGKCGENISWRLDIDGTLTITGTGEMQNHGWTALADSIVSVEISSGVTNVCNEAFKGCTALTNIELPATVTHIGVRAFQSCTALTSVDLPAELLEIGEESFASSGLTSIVIPENITYIPEKAFRSCTALTTVDLPEGLWTIGQAAFQNCYDLETVNYVGRKAQWNTISIMPLNEPLLNAALNTAPALEIAHGVCGDDLTWIVTDDGLLTIEGTGVMYDFYDDNPMFWPYNPMVTDVSLPEGLTHIGHNPFNSARFTYIQIPDTVRSIGGAAFAGVTTLEEIIIPNGVQKLDISVFAYCTSLRSVYIPDSVTVIDTAAFNGCTALRSVDLPDELTDIGVAAFYGSGLESITIPGSVTTFGSSAFVECASLTTVTLEEGITEINTAGVFGAELEEIHLPGTLQRVAQGVFANCSNLTDVYYDDTYEQWSLIDIGQNNDALLNAHIHATDETDGGWCGRELQWRLSDDGVLTIYGTGEMTDFAEANATPWYYRRQMINTIIANDGVTSIGSNAFSGCDRVELVCLPATLERVGANAFIGCDALISVAFMGDQTAWNKLTILSGNEALLNAELHLDGEVVASGDIGLNEDDNVWWTLSAAGVLRIGGTGAMRDYHTDGDDAAPWHWDAPITRVIIEEGVTYVGADAFFHIDTLTDVTIPVSVQEIGYRAFYCDDSLMTVHYNGDYSQWQNIRIRQKNESLIGVQLITADDRVVASGMCGDDLRWKLTAGGALWLSGTGRMTDYSPQNPAPWSAYAADIKLVGALALETNSFSSIGAYAFANCEKLEYVMLDIDTVTTVGDYAFMNCAALQSVDDFFNKIKTMGTGVFMNCRSLRHVMIPYSITSIPDYTFYGCSGLAQINIHNYNKVTDIGDNAFGQCVNLVSIAIPVTLTSIGSGAFDGCSRLSNVFYAGTQDEWEQISIGAWNEPLLNAELTCKTVEITTGSCGDDLVWTCVDGVLTISGTGPMYDYGDDVFYASSPFELLNFTQVIIEPGVASVGQNAFRLCGWLGGNKYRVILGPDVVSIGDTAFGESDLYQINLPEGLKTIGYAAFGTTNLKSLNIPASVTSIGTNLFWDSHDIEQINVASGNRYFASVDGVLFNKDKTKLLQYPVGRTGTYQIPEGVKSIGQSAFVYAIGLKSVIFPSTLKRIETGGLAQTGLTGVLRLPMGLEYIGEYAFSESFNLEEAIIPPTVHTIGTGAFSNSLKTAYFGLFNEYYWRDIIADNAFDSGTELVFEYIDPDLIAAGICSTGGYFGDSNQLMWQLDQEGVLTVDKIDLPKNSATTGAWFEYKDQIVAMRVSDGVTQLPQDSFLGCRKMRTLELPASLKLHDTQNPLVDCVSLTDVKVTGHGSLAFSRGMLYDRSSGIVYACLPGMAGSVVLPTSTRAILDYAFLNCDEITSLRIPHALRNVGYAAFANCSGLSTVSYVGTAADWDEIYINNGNEDLVNANRVYITQLDAGKCGENAYWSIDSDYTLVVSGSGAMYDYGSYTQTPWYAEYGKLIREVIVTEDVTRVGRNAFAYSSSLAYVRIESQADSIGTMAFANCLALTELQIENLRVIEDRAFWRAPLTSVGLPAWIQSISSTAFSGCSSIEGFYTFEQSDNTNNYKAYNGILYNYDMTELVRYPAARDGSVFIVPSSVRVIRDNAFENNRNLTQISMTDSVETIGGYAFSECAALENIILSESLTALNTYLFQNCAQLTAVNVPACVTVLKPSVFRGCHRLTDVTLPDGLTTIGNNAFSSCYALEEIRIPESVRSIESQAFIYTRALNSIALPEGVGSISSYTFYQSGVRQITIPSTVKSVAEYAFDGSALTNVSYAGTRSMKAAMNIARYNQPLLDAEWTLIDGRCGKSLTWSLSEDGVLTIKGTGDMYDYDNLGLDDGNYPPDAKPYHAPWSEEYVASVVIMPGVASVGNCAFLNMEQLVSVDIPGTVKSIGCQTFSGCKKLKHVEVPEGVEKINQDAFQSSGLEVITLPASLRGLNHSAFADCDELRSISVADGGHLITVDGVLFDADMILLIKRPAKLNSDNSYTIPASVEIIGAYAFEGNTELTNVVIPQGVMRIDQYAFSRSGLTSVVLPGSVNVVHGNAFENCPIDLLVIEDGASIYHGECGIPSDSVFSGCQLLTEVNLPGSMERVPAKTFKGCDLESAILEEGITRIESEAFANNPDMSFVTLPASLTYIDAAAFTGDNQPMTVYFAGTPAQWSTLKLNSTAMKNATVVYTDTTIEGVCGENASWKLKGGILEITGSGMVTDPSGYSAYSGQISRVIVRNGVSGLCSYAFDGFRNLTSVSLADSIETIGVAVFRNCSALKQITLPTGLVTLEAQAFYGCENLERITIPATLKTVGRNAFMDCTGLQGVWITDLSDWMAVDFENATANPLYMAHILYLNNKELNALTIPDDVNVVKRFAFAGSDTLTEIVIPDHVTEIGNSAFAECVAVTTVSLADSVTDIGNSAFQGCSALTAISLPVGITKICDNTFNGCRNLKNMDIPAGVTQIGYFAVADCGKLKRVVFGGTRSVWNAIDIKDGNEALAAAEIICAYANGTCGNGIIWLLNEDGLLTITGTGDMADTRFGEEYGETIKTVQMGRGITSIHDYAFSDCSRLSNVVFPDTLTSIGNHAFERCVALKKMTVPGSVRTLGEYVFSRCEGLEYVTLQEGVESLGRYSFSRCITLKAITIPTTLKTVGSSSFYRCTEMNAVHITDLNAWMSIEFSANRANPLVVAHRLFLNGEPVRELTITAEFSTIPEYIFMGCSTLTKVTLEEGVKSIGFGAFSDCAMLSSVTLPGSLEKINGYAFDNCEELVDVDYAGTYEQWDNMDIDIGNDFLLDAAVICQVDVGTCGDELTWSLSDSGRLIIRGTGAMYDYTSADQVPWSAYRSGKYAIREIVFSGALTHIGQYAFEDCAGVTKINLPDSVQSIGTAAFRRNTGLTDISGANGVDTIGDEAFSGCTMLGSLSMQCLRTIGDSAFDGCNSMVSVKLPYTLKNIGRDAFRNCDALTGVFITDLSAWASVSFDMGVSNPLMLAHSLYLNNRLVTDMVIPAGVTDIANYAFAGCTSLRSVTLPVDTRTVGSGSFSGCTEIIRVTATGMTQIGEKAFDGCSSLNEITLTAKIDEILENAFCDCTALEYIHFLGTQAQWDETVIMEGNEPLLNAEVFCTIMAESDTEADGLTWKIGTDGVLMIAYDGDMPDYTSKNPAPWSQFADKITGVVFSETVTGIGTLSMSGIGSIRSAVITDNVTHIGVSAFDGCDLLQVIYFGGTREEWDAIEGLAESGIPFGVRVITNSTGMLDLATDCIIEVAPVAYTGKAVTPVVKIVTSNGIVPTSEYRVTYRENKKVGTGYVTVTPVANSDILTGDPVDQPFEIKIAGGLEITTSLTGKGVKLAWKTNGLVDSYTVSRNGKKVKSGLKSTSFTDSSVGSGMQEYTITAYKKIGKVTYVNSYTVNVFCLLTPATPTVRNLDGAISLSWKAYAGVTSYDVYRKASIGNTKEVRVATVSDTTFTDVDVVNGVTYTYKIVAHAETENGTLTSKKSSAKTIVCLNGVNIKKVSYQKTGVKVEWSKNTKAKGYAIYRNGKKVKTITSSKTTSWTDTAATKNGVTYVYTVRAIYGSSASLHSAAREITYVKAPSAAPKLKTGYDQDSGQIYVKISWKENSSADGYIIYKDGKKIAEIHDRNRTSYREIVNPNKSHKFTVAYFTDQVVTAMSPAASSDMVYAFDYKSGDKVIDDESEDNLSVAARGMGVTLKSRSGQIKVVGARGRINGKFPHVTFQIKNTLKSVVVKYQVMNIACYEANGKLIGKINSANTECKLGKGATMSTYSIELPENTCYIVYANTAYATYYQ